MTFLRAMAMAPLESVTDVIMGRNSGVRPTANTTANRSDCSESRWRNADHHQEEYQKHKRTVHGRHGLGRGRGPQSGY